MQVCDKNYHVAKPLTLQLDLNMVISHQTIVTRSLISLNIVILNIVFTHYVMLL